ncbi:MAG: hypothetical protein KF708_01165 [Pirellulales bacterium]|nr:hypothetical protein [Pirellulales bacterium]
MNLRAILAGTVWLPLLIGCSSSSLESDYGVRQMPGSHQSVNGTTTLARMFELAGDRVSSWRYLSPRLREKADVIVWAPDNFEPPSPKVRAWLEDWLLEKPGRSLIYIGRDYDAAVTYWRQMNRRAPTEQVKPLAKTLSEAQQRFDNRRQAMPADEDCDWFTMQEARKYRDVHTLQGEQRWVEGVDPLQLDISLIGRLIPPPTAETLLGSDGDTLIAREVWGESQLIVVTNGSFLLNLPLVNHEHRKLAQKLVAEVGENKNVFFLESGFIEPVILEEDPELGLPTGLEVFTIYPFNQILLHLALVGVLFAFARYWIFGIPRESRVEHEADFGQHVDALGQLLEKTRDAEYARERLAHYRLASRGEAAGFHPAAATTAVGMSPVAMGSGATQTTTLPPGTGSTA